MKRVFIIHGWDDNPQNGWFPWLKKKLMAEGVEVHVPSMPDASHPTIEVWVPFLQHAVGHFDDQTFFIGHSVGGQTILRAIERLSDGAKVGGVVLVAPWLNLKPAALNEDETATVALPWIQRPLDWPKIRLRLNNVTVIMSDDDQFVPLEDGKTFVRELKAKFVVEHQKKHLSGFDGVTILHSAYAAIEGMLSQST